MAGPTHSVHHSAEQLNSARLTDAEVDITRFAVRQSLKHLPACLSQSVCVDRIRLLSVGALGNACRRTIVKLSAVRRDSTRRDATHYDDQRTTVLSSSLVTSNATLWGILSFFEVRRRLTHAKHGKNARERFLSSHRFSSATFLSSSPSFRDLAPLKFN